MSGGNDSFGIGAAFNCLAGLIFFLVLALAEVLVGFLVSWTIALWILGAVTALVIGAWLGRALLE